MMRTVLLALGLSVLLGACEPKGLQMTETPVLGASAAAGCNASAAAEWAPGPVFTATAQVSGPDCASAVVLLTVRDAQKEPALVWAAPVKYVFGLKDAATSADMTAALGEFLTQRDGYTTSDLPEWVEGETLPGGEFPFHPESWIDAEGYAALRAGAAPLYAFPQGHESLAVYALRDGQLELIGVQQFPG